MLNVPSRSRHTRHTRRTVLAATSVLGTALAACGAPGAPSGGKTAPKITGTLTYWPEGGQTNASYQAWVARIADFQKAYPEAKVEMTDTQDRDPKLVAAITAGTPPDLSVYDRYTIAAGQARGFFKDLQPLAKTAGIKGEDQQPWVWEEVARDGKLWGLPYSTDTRMVYVNAAHLKKAGIPLTPPKTLDDFDRIMRQLTVGRPGSFERIGFVPWGNWNNWRLFGWGWLHGGDWWDAKANRVTMDHPKNIAALEWELARANELGGFDAVNAWRSAQPKTGTMDMLKAGTLSAVINSTSQLIGMFAEKDLDWIVWPNPPAAGVAKSHTWSGGFANVLPTGVKNPEASFELARYLSDEEFQKVQNKTGQGRMPTLKKAAQDPFWQTVDPRVKLFLEQLPNSHIRPPIVQIAIMDRELDQAEGAETTVLKGQNNPRAALALANQRVNDAIKENRAS